MKLSSLPIAKIFLTVLFGLFANATFAEAGPSGGPYGPQLRRYLLPNSGNVFYVSPSGSPDLPGKNVDNTTTLAAAIERAVTGDSIVLRGGVYRTGDLQFNQGITLQPYGSERPILKGTRVATEWEALRGNLWRVSWKTLFPMKPESWWRREREAGRTPIYLFNNDMVFADGRPLKQVGWAGEVGADGFFIDYETGHVYIGFDPADRLMEITAFDNALTRSIDEVYGRKSDGKGPTIRGIVFTQYAYRALEISGYDPEGVSPEAEHGKDVVGATIENCAFTFCSRVAAYLRGDNLVFRHNLVSDTSTEGIFLLASNDALFERNIFRRNNIEGITGYYPSAVKIFNQTHRVVCRDNLIYDNRNSNGIWYDVGNQDGLFVDNWIQDTNDGFFFEISKRAICAGNVFVNCDKGVRVLNSADVKVYHNTFVNSRASFERTARSAVGDHFGWHPATGPEVEERVDHVFANNLLWADEDYRGPLLQFEQPAELRERLKMSHATQVDGNVYVRQGDRAEPVLRWSPDETDTGVKDYLSLEDFAAAHPGFERYGLYLSNYYGPLFKGFELGRLELDPDFPAAAPRVEVPKEIRKLMGEKGGSTIGALPIGR